MAESTSHQKLVASLAAWVAREFFGGSLSAVLVDEPSAYPGQSPPAINGAVPDVYGRGPGGIPTVIGEAKPAWDVGTRRTQSQWQAFLRACAENDGCVQVVAVPWQMERTAKGLLRTLKRQMHIEAVRTMVIEKRCPLVILSVPALRRQADLLWVACTVEGCA
ncbi:MAG: hypothetical protein ACYC63_21070 [Armatimonadota bacterium]